MAAALYLRGTVLPQQNKRGHILIEKKTKKVWKD
jgi:hypothetical protein